MAKIRDNRALHRGLLPAIVVVAVAACTNTPVLPVAIGASPVPEATGTPRSGYTGPGSIQLIAAPTGVTGTVVTPLTPTVTVVASTQSGTASSARVGAGPGAAAHRLLATATTGGEDLVMPYRSSFRPDGPLPGPGKARYALKDAPIRTVGDREAFWVNTGSSKGAKDLKRTAVLRRLSDNACFYVDAESTRLTETNLDDLVHQFETQIYPRVTQVFGAEARPGIDGDDRIAILISPAVDDFGKEKGLMGYFWYRDAIPNSPDPHTNKREMLFMTDRLFDYEALTSFGTMAHEFQHLINFTRKGAASKYTQAEDTWLDEGLSMYAMEVSGYGLPAGDNHVAKDLNEFQQDPTAFSLTDWNGNPHGFAYGMVYLFVRYLVDRFGVGVIRELLDSPKTGKDAVEEVLAKRGVKFADFFRDWAITNLVSGKPVAAGTPYNYQGIDLAGKFGTFQLKGMQAKPVADAAMETRLRPWGSTYATFKSLDERAWQVQLSGKGSEGLAGAAILGAP